MAKVKIKTLIGATLSALFFLTAIVAFVFYAFPARLAAATGLGPWNGQQILTFCALLIAVVSMAGWLTERLFTWAGRSGLNLDWRESKRQAQKKNGDILPLQDDDEATIFNPQAVAEHLRLRYGRRWKRIVRILLVAGHRDEVQKVSPGLCQDLWQEGDGNLLLYAGEAQAAPDVDFIAVLKRLRAARPADGMVQVLDCSALPSDTERDLFLRSRQKADGLLGWQLPVWLWLTDNSIAAQDEQVAGPAGAMFSPGAQPEAVSAAFARLVPLLREAGMAQLLKNTLHDGLLLLSYRLETDLKKPLVQLIGGLTQGVAAYQLRGVLFSPPLRTGGLANACAESPFWQVVTEDFDAARPKKLTFDARRALRLCLLSAVALWAAGTLLSLGVNQSQIHRAQETARAAADTRQPLTARLHNQLVLQQTIAHLQNREATGAPWYTRFGLNQDAQTQQALWPLYARNNTLLIRDVAAERLAARLRHFVSLPPASEARSRETKRAYDALKSYLMLAHPNKADAPWLARNILAFWPERQGVSQGSWQQLAPKLLGFYARNLSAHPQWKITPDSALVGNVRQILLKQIGQRNAEAGLYQEMLRRVASNWPDLTLADMIGDTDASEVFRSDEVVPGMFTRQAWEEQVQGEIEEVVNTRRNEIDWVLTDKTHPAGSDISPEALKARLTERYFTDFGNAWLGMMNSIQWHEATSLSEAIAQLNLIADVRQSPLVALMNTLAWQGKTGEKKEVLADSIVDSAKALIGSKKPKNRPFAEQAQGPRGPLLGVFGPLTGLMEGKDGTVRNGNLSFQSWLARVTQVRLKLQQVTSAPDPQAMSQMLAQTVFQGKAIVLTDTRDYGSLVAASLGQEWNGFGQALFVQPLDLAWRQVLTPAADSLNIRWQSAIVAQWNKAFAGRYPFKTTGSDASLALLAQFVRSDSGRIASFLKTSLGGILHQEGNRWVVDPSASQGMTVDPEFVRAINQLADLSDVVFSQGDAGIHFELMARPSRDVARVLLTLDEQKLDYFNQMESWQSFTWPGETYYPGVTLSWRSTSTGMQLYANNQGNWGFIRLLDKARVTWLDASRASLVWMTPGGNPLKFILRSELGEGPLALLKLRGFRLPERIFVTDAVVAEDID